MPEMDSVKHELSMTDGTDGFAPAQLRTTTYGVEYLLTCVRANDSEAPDAELHRVLLKALEDGLGRGGSMAPQAAKRRDAVLALQALQKEIRRLVDGSLTWQDKYALLFSDAMSKQVYAQFAVTGIPFDYHDPDSDEDDVRAFADALDGRLAEIADFFAPAVA